MFGGLIAASNLPASQKLGEGPRDWQKRSLTQTALFGTLFHCPDSLFAFLFYPDWNLGYFVPWESVGFLGALFLEAVLFGLLLLGCWWATSGRMTWGRVMTPPVMGLVGFAVVMVVIWDRYSRVGDYAQYHAGTAVLSAESSTFQMFTTLAGAYLIVPLLTLLTYNLLRARKAANDAGQSASFVPADQ
jgi:hypothetical protein